MIARIILIALLCQIHINTFAKDKKGVKYVYSPISIRANYKANYFLSKGKGSINMNTKFGHGIELLLENRVNNNYFFDIGFHALSYVMDTASGYEQLRTAYEKPGYYTSILTMNSTGNMSQFGFSTSFGKIIQMGDLQLNPYLKLGLSFFSYNAQAIIYVSSKTSNELNFHNVNGKKSNASIVPALGLKGDYKISRLLYLACGVETGYVIVGHQLLVGNTNQQHINTSETQNIATPKMYIGGNIGLILKPFNRVRESESKYNDEHFLRNKEIGN